MTWRAGGFAEAFELVGSLVVTDLAQQVADGVDVAEHVAELGRERLPVQLGVLGDEGHVGVFGVVLEDGVEPVAVGGADQ